MLEYVQVLRFLAAMGVVLHHAQAPTIPAAFVPEWPSALKALFQAGFAGVDLFFVISGAIMAESTRLLTAGPAASLRFIAVRFSRIYIGWWPFFVLYLAAFAFAGWLRPGIDLPGSFFLLPMGLNKYLLPIVWTLSFELYFYLVVGALLLLPRRGMCHVLRAWALVIVLFTLYGVASGMFTPARFGEITVWHSFLGSPLVLEFIAGFLVCDYLRDHPETPWQPVTLTGLGLLAVAVAYQHLGGLHDSGLAGYFHAPERAVLLGGAACCAVACALLWKPPVRPWLRIMARLGDASYAIYLSHLLTFITFYFVVLRLGVPSSFRIALYAVVLSAVMVYSWLHFRWVERPLYLNARNRIESLFR